MSETRCKEDYDSERPALAIRCDVTDRVQVDAPGAAAWSAFDRVEIVVNNAGVFPWSGNCP
jgi:NAD(P)-dependent dehydrogenase (short-subunit alcohol dehydrogenase family)